MVTPWPPHWGHSTPGGREQSLRSLQTNKQDLRIWCIRPKAECCVRADYLESWEFIFHFPCIFSLCCRANVASYPVVRCVPPPPDCPQIGSQRCTKVIMFVWEARSHTAHCNDANTNKEPSLSDFTGVGFQGNIKLFVKLSYITLHAVHTWILLSRFNSGTSVIFLYNERKP